ncbi:MAG: hypothetical protein KDI28_04820 [Pseudomonadales bacterium]|nr:hypothetical protein [Pseudomonadales bacterium]MCP5357944.1 hypothetical protein [Pseudomonadales bacterium]
MTNLEDEIEVIEAGYEFLLAYAAQGRPAQNEGVGPGPHPRETLQGMLAAMKKAGEQLVGVDGEFEQVMVQDLKKAQAAVGFVLAQPKIGSEVVDNLNASIHLRTVLTDFFLYSEAFKPLGTEQAQQPAWDKVGN